MDRDKIACKCNHVTYGDIVDAVEAGAKTFAEVQEKTNCARGCGKYQEFIEVMVRNVQLFPEDYK